MKRARLNNRTINLAGIGICFASLLIAIFYMEKVLGLKPCPLCILSRYVIVTMGFVFLVGVIDHQKYVRQFLYTGINTIFAAIGIAIAGRHMWIQYHPSLTCSIGPVPKNILTYITKAFAGSSDCAKNDWQFLGMTVPEQTLVLFLVLTLLLVLQFYINLKTRSRERLRDSSPNH